MTEVYSICSSSKGNATFIGSKESGILVDAGVGIRIFTKYLAEHDISENALKAIFITHEHSDHTKGLINILKKWRIPVYGSIETLEELIAKQLVPANADLNEIKSRSVCIDDIEASAFCTPHDSANSLGFKLKLPKNKTMCVCTDLGCMPDSVYQNLKGCSFVLLESNYDEAMLTYGDYPYMLKHRILGENGHLSNKLCGETLKRLLADGTENFLLGHLSENNNRPKLAYDEAIHSLSEIGACINHDYILSVAPVRSTGQIIAV